MFHHDLNHTGTSTSKGPTTNNTLWSYMTGGWAGSTAVVDGFVYAGSNDTKVYCLNAANGTLAWTYKTGGWVWSCPAVDGGLLYVGSVDGNVYCLNATTGAFVWSYTTLFSTWGNSVYSSPAVAGGRVYVGSNDGRVYCLNATTGSSIWSLTTGGSIGSSPAVVAGFVYVGSLDGEIYCLNATTGTAVWIHYTSGSGVNSSPSVVSGLVYVGGLDGKVYCLNATTGAFVWSYTTANYVDSSPAVVGGLVYVGSWDTKVYCLNATTGTFVWSYSTGGSIRGSCPAVVGGFVYVGSNDAKVFCLNATTGAFVWSYATGALPGNPAVVDVVYVGSMDGRVYAFGEPVAVSISPSSAVMDVGQSQLFTSNVTGGTSPYKYQWYLNLLHVTGATTLDWTFTPSSSGSYTVYVNAIDSVGAWGFSEIVSVTVNPPPHVNISPTSVIMNVGQSKLFTSSVSDGTSPYSYQWYLNNNPVSGANSATWTFVPTSPGSYNIYLNVTDAVSTIAESNMATTIARTLSLDSYTTWYWTSNTQVKSTAVGDVNGDGQVETVTGGCFNDGTRNIAQLIVWNSTDMAAEHITCWYWTGNTVINSVALGDVDGDGQTEIVTGGSFFDGTRNVAQLIVWSGSNPAVKNIQCWYWTGNTAINSVAIGEVDADGQIEIVTGGYFNDGVENNAQLIVWTGSTLAVDKLTSWYWTGDTVINSVALGDADADGQVEIATGGSFNDGVRDVAQLILWTGSSLAVDRLTAWYWTGNTVINSVAMGDVNSDGQVEVVTGGFFNDGARNVAQLIVWTGYSLAVDRLTAWYWTSNTVINSVGVGDVDGDGQKEIVTAGKFNDGSRDVAQLIVWSGSGLSAKYIQSWFWTSNTAINSVAVGDVNGDSLSEIVAGGAFYDGARGNSQLTIWGMN
jgi:outer membrane protein assembly factor BamB